MVKGRTRYYGVPYQGSKNFLAARIVEALPPGGVFVDLFAGGCAVTHAAMLSGKWRRFIANDMDGRGVRLFADAVAGRYRDERRVVDREYFHANKDSDAYVSLCWSFGNGGECYLWGPDIEGLKLAACRMVMAATPAERRMAYMDYVRRLREKIAGDMERLGRLESLERLGRLQSLERLGRLQSLEGLSLLDRLGTLASDYREVDIPAGAVVYCDPPYQSTRKYRFTDGFDSAAFHEWVRTREYPVWVSEYNMPADFTRVAEWGHLNRMSAKTRTRVVEGLFVHERWADKVAKTELF